MHPLKSHTSTRTRENISRPASGLVINAPASVLAGRESYQDLVNWYCSLLTRRTVCGGAAGNTPRTQKQAEWNETRNKTNSVVSLQNHCSYKMLSTKHQIKKRTWTTAMARERTEGVDATRVNMCVCCVWEPAWEVITRTSAINLLCFETSQACSFVFHLRIKITNYTTYPPLLPVKMP